MDTAEGKKAVISAIAPIPVDRKEKSIRPKQIRYWTYDSRSGKPLVRACREDFGDERKPWRWQESWDGEKWVKGLKGIKREDIPIYKYKEIKEAIAAGEIIFIAEGEPCCDALWKLGIPATTNIGGSGKWKPSDTKDLQGASQVVLCPDRDKPGVAHAEAIASDFSNAKWLYAFPDSPFWNNLPPNQGLDVVDWIEHYQLEADDIWEAIEPRREDAMQEEPTEPAKAEENYTQKCQAALYSDKPWISLHGKLCFWTGTYYQESPKEEEIQRITSWCSTTRVQVGKNKWKYAYATATYVDNIWNWLQRDFSHPPSQVNPPGINCLNGVVKIKWNGRHPSWELIDHDPKVVYTYVSEIKFDPKADSAYCDQMLSCLEPREQKLFVQTMAASLDLKTIRKYRGRKVRALLCKGHGNNGKDSLREAVRLLFGGMGMSDATISDFSAYDHGRKFDLYKLLGARINWSSENSSIENLDRIESLKRAITGEQLDSERKGVDATPMSLQTVFLFNINEAPNLKAALEAIQSRFAVLSFNKTYKEGADPNKGEIEADSRFRYDENFLKEKVCPALLNKMLHALSTLAIDGIDYSCTTQALQDIQEETNHLWAFAREVGLDYCTGGRIYINDLWELLFRWYINNGTLEIISENGKEKKIWHDQPRRSDKNVKAPNQIHQRFSELFPKIKKVKNNDASEGLERKGQFYLSGIAIGEAMEKQWRSNGEAVSFAQSQGEAREAIKLNGAGILDNTKKLSSEQKRELASILLSDKELASFILSELRVRNSFADNFTAENLAEVEPTASLASPLDVERVTASPTASPSASPASPTASPTVSPTDQFKVGSRVANIDPTNTSYNWHGTIVRLGQSKYADVNGAEVSWDERKGMKGGQVLFHRLEELRLI